MAKTEKIRYSKVAVLIDGVQLSRAQSIGHNADLSREKLLELANTQVVQYIDNVPSVSITIDTNDIGSIDTLRLAASHLYQYSTSTEVRTGGYLSQIKNANVNVNTAVTDQHLLESKVDIAVAISEDGSAVSRTAWFHNAALSGISWNYDVNGFSQENYTFTSDNKTWFVNGWAGARILPLRYNQIGAVKTATSQYFYIDSAAISGITDSVIAIGINENIVYKSESANWHMPALITAGALGKRLELQMKTTGILSIPFASSAARTDKVVVVLKPNTTQTWTGGTKQTVGASIGFNNTANPGYNLVTTAGSIGGRAREFLLPIFYNTQGPSGKTTEATNTHQLRLQTISIDVSPGADPLNQLGTKEAYSYDIEEPLPITVSITALDSDLEMLAKAMSTALTSVKQIRLGDFSGANNLAIRTFKDRFKTPSKALKSIRLSSMTLTGVNDSVSVGGNATSELTFECSNITCSAGAYGNPNK